MKRTSPEKHASPLTTNAMWSSLCPGVGERLDAEPADLERAGDDRQAELGLVLDVVGIGVRAEHVRRLDAPLARAAASSGSIGAPLSTKTAAPPSSSATR